MLRCSVTSLQNYTVFNQARIVFVSNTIYLSDLFICLSVEIHRLCVQYNLSIRSVYLSICRNTPCSSSERCELSRCPELVQVSIGKNHCLCHITANLHCESCPGTAKTLCVQCSTANLHFQSTINSPQHPLKHCESALSHKFHTSRTINSPQRHRYSALRLCTIASMQASNQSRKQTSTRARNLKLKDM